MMKIALDIGNTSTTIGLIAGGCVEEAGRLDTALLAGSDDVWGEIEPMLHAQEGSSGEIDGGIIASVVPSVTGRLEKALRRRIGKPPLIVGPDLDLGIRMAMARPGDVGADRIANAVAAFALYGGPVIVVDLGTAITFEVVDSGGDFLGGAIAPGILTAGRSLAERGAQLFAPGLEFPSRAIGGTTDEALRSGVLRGAIAMIDGLVRQMLAEIGEDDAVVIATGGFAGSIAPHSKTIARVDRLLTLKGLMLLDERNG